MKTRRQIREQIKPLTNEEKREHNIDDNNKYYIYVYSSTETEKAGINSVLSDNYKTLVNTVFESLK